MSNVQLDPSHIMQVGSGFWASKTLLSAVELQLFTHLGTASMTGAELGEQAGLHKRGTDDFLDTLVALRFLDRDGDGAAGRYRNTAETAAFLDKQSPTYIGGILEMFNARLYQFWGSLTEALQTGKPQNEIKHTGTPMFDELYGDSARLEQFMHAMEGISLGNFHALAGKFDFSRYTTVCDVGGATGQLCAILATQIHTCDARRLTFRSSRRSRPKPSPLRTCPSASPPHPGTSSSIPSPERMSSRWA